MGFGSIRVLMINLCLSHGRSRRDFEHEATRSLDCDAFARRRGARGVFGQGRSIGTVAAFAYRVGSSRRRALCSCLI